MGISITSQLNYDYNRTITLRKESILFSHFLDEKIENSLFVRDFLFENVPLFTDSPILEYAASPITSVLAGLTETPYHNQLFLDYPGNYDEKIDPVKLPLLSYQDFILANGYYPYFRALTLDAIRQNEKYFRAIAILYGKMDDPVFREDQQLFFDFQQELKVLLPNSSSILQYEYPDKKKLLALPIGFLRSQIFH